VTQAACLSPKVGHRVNMPDSRLQTTNLGVDVRVFPGAPFSFAENKEFKRIAVTMPLARVFPSHRTVNSDNDRQMPASLHSGRFQKEPVMTGYSALMGKISKSALRLGKRRPRRQIRWMLIFL